MSLSVLTIVLGIMCLIGGFNQTAHRNVAKQNRRGYEPRSKVKFE